MKYLLILLLAGLAALEFFHHISDGDALNAIICMDAQAKPQAARELLERHLHGHR